MNELKTPITIFGAIVSALYTALFIPIILLVVANIGDYISGLTASYFRGDKIVPSKALKGVLKKISLWLIVCVGIIMDIALKYSSQAFGVDIKFNFLISSAVCIWLLSTELLSILQNTASLGVKYPPFIQPIIENLLKSLEDKK